MQLHIVCALVFFYLYTLFVIFIYTHYLLFLFIQVACHSFYLCTVFVVPVFLFALCLCFTQNFRPRLLYFQVFCMQCLVS